MRPPTITLERFMSDRRLREMHHYSALMCHLYYTIEELKKTQQDESIYHQFYYKRMHVIVRATTWEILDTLAWMGNQEIADYLYKKIKMYINYP